MKLYPHHTDSSPAGGPRTGKRKPSQAIVKGFLASLRGLPLAERFDRLEGFEKKYDVGSSLVDLVAVKHSDEVCLGHVAIYVKRGGGEDEDDRLEKVGALADAVYTLLRQRSKDTGGVLVDGEGGLFIEALSL